MTTKTDASSWKIKAKGDDSGHWADIIDPDAYKGVEGVETSHKRFVLSTLTIEPRSTHNLLQRHRIY